MPFCLPCAVGFCLLLAQPLGAALQPLLPQQPTAGSNSSSGSAPAPPQQRGRAAATALLLAALLGFYAVRTVERNKDWWDEERLFRAAQKVGVGWLWVAGWTACQLQAA